MSSDAPAPEKTADALVGRLFEASSACSRSCRSTSVIGLASTEPCATAARPRRPSSPRGPASTPRYAREWLEQQAVAGILDVDDAAADADAPPLLAARTAYAEPLLDPDSPYSIAPLARSVVACAKAIPELLEAYRTGGGVDWADYGAGHDRGPGRLQPAVAARLVRHRDPAGHPGDPRAARRRSAGPRRRRRLRRRLGGDRDRHGLPERHASTASTSTRPRSSSPGERRARPASPTG